MAGMATPYLLESLQSIPLSHPFDSSIQSVAKERAQVAMPPALEEMIAPRSQMTTSYLLDSLCPIPLSLLLDSM